MGGSSLAPEVFRRSFDAANFHVLDTTHPTAIRRLQESIDVGRTFFVASSKSGTTLETRSHLEHFWAVAGQNPEQFAVVTDPGSDLESLAQEREFHAVFHGEPTIGGRYSALSAFGLVAAALIGADVDRIRTRAREMAEACRSSQDNPGLKLGFQFGEGWQDGRDKICIEDAAGGFGLWAEQLIAESTGKEGKGLVPAPGESPAGPDRQRAEVQLRDPYDLGAEFFRWEFATAVAGSTLGINAFNQPDVQSAKDRTNQILGAGGDPDVAATGSLDELMDGAEERDYICVQAFIDPTEENEARIMELVDDPRPHWMRDHARLWAAVPALDRSAAQGRAADRPLRPGRRRHRRRDPDPRQGLRLRQADLRPGGRRLRLAAGARPSHHSNQIGGD